jgi:hypothetical protein
MPQPRSFLPALALLLGCGGDPDHPAGGPAQAAPVAEVRLMSRPAPGFRSIHLNVASVEVRGTGDWQLLAEPRRTLDLQSLTASDGLLATRPGLEPGAFRQFRLRVAPSGNTVVLADGAIRPLVLPEALKDGLRVDLAGEPRRRQHHHAYHLVLDCSRAVLPGEEAGTYTFSPSGWATDEGEPTFSPPPAGSPARSSSRTTAPVP